MKYKITIISGNSKFIQVVEAKDEREALNQISYTIFECFDEYILTVEKFEPVNLFLI